MSLGGIEDLLIRVAVDYVGVGSDAREVLSGEVSELSRTLGAHLSQLCQEGDALGIFGTIGVRGEV